MPLHRPLAIAHRGAHRDHPENSLPAILAALALGAQGIEIDVHATLDGVLVVHHDPDLRDGGAIREMSAADVSARQLAPGIGIPRLEEVLEAVCGRAVLFIETKVPDVELPLIRAIRASDAESAVHSLHLETIGNIKRLMPALRAGVLTSGAPEAAIAALRAASADDLWHEASDIGESLVRACHLLGKQIIAWTANSEAEVRRLSELGVDGICTDDIPLCSAGAP